MNHRRRCTPSISIFVLIHLAFLQGANSFSPFFLGPEFRNISFVNEEMNDRLAEICGRSKKIGEREYPWAVSIMLQNGVNRLGGSIISPYHILTVAHGFMSFHGGDERPCMMTVYRPIVEIRSRIVGYGGRCIRGYSDVLPNHPDCPEPDVTFNRIRSVLIDETFVRQGCHHGHDWAIVELEERIEFTDKQKPICLPPPSVTVEPVIITAGWGRSYNSESAFQDECEIYVSSQKAKDTEYRSLVREQVFNESGPLIHEIPMVVDPKCDRPRTDKLPSKAADYICATSMDMDDYFAPRTCHGDSGAGMEQLDERKRSILVALTSFGTKGCPSNELARFTRVDHYLQPICAHTGVCYSYIGRII